MRVVPGATGSADILSASGRSPLQFFIYKNSFSKEFALRAQADKMSALPIAPGTHLMLCSLTNV